ncbi:hypothetical protein WMY93_010455 [Mugilogobius chulae]|uniref:Protein-serine/threonine phosphatase n=1 Tax=Mugilogobius chulae TaxID=88201 RepID=A0AAW0PD36_9GOBI
MENTKANSDTPSVKELVKVLYGGKRVGNHVDEVWPNLFLGDMTVANDRYSVWKLGITHVLNAAHGRPHSEGGPDFYGPSVVYYGIPLTTRRPLTSTNTSALQLSSFTVPCRRKMCKWSFNTFPDEGNTRLSWPPLMVFSQLNVKLTFTKITSDLWRGRVLVHCAVGVSRSASLVLSFLMQYHRLPLLGAILTVKEHRWIFPNKGFLVQLRALDFKLRLHTGQNTLQLPLRLILNLCLGAAPVCSRRPAADTLGPESCPKTRLYPGSNMMSHRRKRKEYLTVKDLQKMLDSCKLHLGQVDEVWPNIYIGNM